MRGHERAGVVELLQDPHGSRAAGQRIGERPADALEHGGAQQQLAHLGRLAVQDLGQQISPRRCARCPRTRARSARDPSACELRRRRGAGRRPTPRCAREARPRRHPTARPRRRRAARASRSSEKRRSDRPELGQATREAQPVESHPHRRRASAARRGAAPASASGSVELRPPLADLSSCRSSMSTRLLEGVQAGEQPLDEQLATERGGRGLRPRCRASTSVTDARTAPSRSSGLTVAQPACASEPGLGDPRAQQARLSARGRPGDHGDGARPGKPLEERAAGSTVGSPAGPPG